MTPHLTLNVQESNLYYIYFLSYFKRYGSNQKHYRVIVNFRCVFDQLKNIHDMVYLHRCFWSLIFKSTTCMKPIVPHSVSLVITNLTLDVNATKMQRKKCAFSLQAKIDSHVLSLPGSVGFRLVLNPLRNVSVF